MTMAFTVFIALLLSALAIVALCIGDPKRLRTAGGKRVGMVPRHRRKLVAVACAPGLVCLLMGNTAAFLLWLGGSALFGWALAGYCGLRTSKVRRAD